MIGTAAPAGEDRFTTLDLIRGVAVLGILAMNIVGFAMPSQAYVNPHAYDTGSWLDLASYFFSFVLIDGKMRGLFSLLFGASLLLVSDRAEAAGQSSASATYRRLWWLLLFGLAHFYLIWAGDILVSYALIGAVAWLFRRFDVRSLVMFGLMLIALQFAVFAQIAASSWTLADQISRPDAAEQTLGAWKALQLFSAPPTVAQVSADLTLHLGPWPGLVRHQLTEATAEPLVMAAMFAPETLGLMLLGMAGLKSGFLTGHWNGGRYGRVAAASLTISLPAYAVLAWLLSASGFSVPAVFTFSLAATVPFRVLMVIGYAALIILVGRSGGPLVLRLAAAGRAAFSNYLGSSLVMTALFYGWGAGLYGSLSRAELWIPVVLAWAAMLAWSKPWLDRFRYGPFEWLWRSLARWEWRRPVPAR